MFHPTNNKSRSQKIVWHLKILAGSVIISFIFGIILQQKLVPEQFPSMLFFTFVQLEIFIWLGAWFFDKVKHDSSNFIRAILLRLLLFYTTVLFVAFLMFLAIFTYHFIKNGTDFSEYFSSLLNMELKGFLIATLVGFSFGALFFFYVQWAEAIKRFQKLKEEKLIFQYESLKSQVNPHFLFNSLNTLSSLVRKDADLSEEFTQKLSSVYRYILDNKDKELVPLSTETELTTDYFYLQKIRDQEKIDLKIEIQDISNLEVVPVSLQLLVENALKHNSATRSQPLEIIIHNEGIDKLVVRNNLQKKTQLSDSSKIGLKNLNERCRLILNREIEIMETANEFVVKIPAKIT